MPIGRMGKRPSTLGTNVVNCLGTIGLGHWLGGLAVSLRESAVCPGGIDCLTGLAVYLGDSVVSPGGITPLGGLVISLGDSTACPGGIACLGT